MAAAIGGAPAAESACKAHKTAPLVSVIVAMYNIRPYARECLESLRRMAPIPGETTEIIIVDDGSTDGTADVIDGFLRAGGPAWPQSCDVTVLHIANGGLSAARNTAVARARGRFVSFVDGDDAVCPDYLTALGEGLQAIGGPGARHPLVIGTLTSASGRKAMRAMRPVAARSMRIRTLTAQQALNEALTGAVPINACAKLAPREHYLAHPYPEQRTYEDLATLVTLLRHAGRVAVLERPIYRYRHRADSLSHPLHPTIRQVHDFFDALNAFSRSCEQAFGSGVDQRRLKYQLALQCMRLHRLIRFALRTAAGQAERSELRAIDAHVTGTVLRIGGEAQQAGGIGRIPALRIRLFRLSRPLYDCIFDAYECLQRRD